MEFQPFPKIHRISRDCIITEKIDGTNASITIIDIFGNPPSEYKNSICRVEDKIIFAGSRSRFITVENDNYGFASWVKENISDLMLLGDGIHYGEWWGQGIQRNYGLNHKRFSLFNVSKWNEDTLPSCCHVVPILKMYTFSTYIIDEVLEQLKENGSYASPGFLNPEGIVVFHCASGFLFKKTIEKDKEYKGKKINDLA